MEFGNVENGERAGHGSQHGSQHGSPRVDVQTTHRHARTHLAQTSHQYAPQQPLRRRLTSVGQRPRRPARRQRTGSRREGAHARRRAGRRPETASMPARGVECGVWGV
eukprot:365227-Chlamydomonas_euryale.AAC.10